jgi:hypothetical protein
MLQTPTQISTKESVIMTQTRQTTQQLPRFPKAMVLTDMVAGCCGLLLCSAVSAHAVSINGLHLNGLTPNVITLQREPLPAVPQASLPFNGLSQRVWGKHLPPYCKGNRCIPKTS